MTTVDRRRTSPATREALLRAATGLLTGGASVASLNVERIAREAGMSRATFYLHFADKRELVGALAEDLFAWREYIGAEVLADPAMQRETLDAMMQLIVGRWSENQAVLAAIIEVAEYDSEFQESWRLAMQRIAETAAVQLDARWQKMPGNPGDPAVIAEIFTWMFERTCHQMLRGGLPPEQLAAALTEVVWRVISFPVSE